MKEGVISHFNNMQFLLQGLLNKEKFLMRGSKYIVAVPTDVTEVEKRAYYDLVVHSAARAKEVLIVERGIADAVGLGLDVLNDLNGNYVTTIAKKKLAMRAGETDVAQIVSNDCFLSTAGKLSKTLKHVANLDVDCFVDNSGHVFVLELNCRFGGQYPFSHNAGVDFPKQLILWCNGKSTDMNLLTPKIGVMSCKDLNPVICEYE